MAARVKRVASVPKRSMISSGSITLPLVFDIFCRSASRTSAWMYTCRKGTLSFFFSPLFPLTQPLAFLIAGSCSCPSMKWQPNMIMRATQKNRIS